jgi:thiol-disulfide isomerase/thioredoxin
MTMATIKRIVIHYLLLELNHDSGHNEENSNVLLTTGAKSVINYYSLHCGHCHDLAPVVSNKLLLSLLWPLS